MATKNKMDQLNAMLENGLTDDLDLDFDEEEQETPVKIKEEPVKEAPKGKMLNVKPERETPFVSDTLDSLLSNMKTKKEIEKIEESSPLETVSTNDLLSNIKVDLTNIQLSTGFNAADILKNQQEVLGKNKTMQVVCCQSAYSARVSALRNQEIQNINNDNVSVYLFKQRLYKTLWQHIEDTSVGKMDFNTWMKVTSFFDVETLLYGIFCETFPYENTYPATCPKCEREFKAVVANNSLIEIRGNKEETYAKIDEVVSSIKNPGELLEHSHVHTTNRVILDVSKIIVDIQIPSVYDYLERTLGKVQNKQEFAEENSNSLALSMFIKKVFIPDLENLRRTGTLTYIPVEDSDKFTDLIANLDFKDGNKLSAEVDKFVGSLQISYSLKGITCPECGHQFPSQTVPMEDMLFIEINRVMRE